MKSVRIALAVIGLAAIAWLIARSRRHDVHAIAAQSDSSRPSVSNGFGMFGASSEDEASEPATISGHVRLQSGKPVAGAMACAFCAECEDALLAADLKCEPTDEKGEYVLRHLRPTDYQVSISAEGFAPRIANKGEPVHLQGKDVVLPDTELAEGGAEIVGTVSDATGGPVAGATVRASFQSDDLPPGRYLSQITKSDQTGAFKLSVNQVHVLLVAEADGYAGTRLGTYPPAQGLRLLLTPSSRISGSVVAQLDHSPIEGVRVVARGDRGAEQVATSDAAGAFTITGLRPGVYNVNAAGDGWIGRHSGSVTVDISDSAENVLVQVQRAVSVAGTMKVGDGFCRSGRVTLAPAPGRALPTLSALGDLSGGVSLKAVPAGVYNSSALCDGYGSIPGPEVRVTDKNVTGLTWNFEKGVDLIVHAVTPENAPVGRAWVYLTQSSDTARAESTAPKSRRAQADQNGVARFLGVSEGTYMIGAPEVDNPVTADVRASKDPLEFTITMKSVGAIDVVVKDAQGRPNDSVAVRIASKDGHPGGGIGESRGDGHYHAGPLPPGEYRVELRDGVDPVAEVDGAEGSVRVKPGQVTVVEATYGGHSGRITGRVLDGGGMPLENVWVSARGADSAGYGTSSMFETMTHANERRSLTNTDGRFVIEGLLETGVFAVVASHSLGGEARVEGVKTGQDVQLALSSPGSLSGVVLDSNGQPPAYFQIQISNKANGQQLTPQFGPDAEGKWFVDHVAPGTIEITAQTPDGYGTVARELGPSQKVADVELRLQPVPKAPPRAQN